MISVIIPTFKRANMLFYEIEQLLKQEKVDIEIIVVNDDLENDPTDEIKVKYPDVKYIKHAPKIGPGQKHQVGFEVAKGEYVSFPDDDDYLVDSLFFYKAITKMEEDPTLSFVSGNSYKKYEDEEDINKQIIKHPLNVSGKYDGLDYLENVFGKYQKPLSSFPTVFRKKALEACNFMEQIEMSDVSIYLLACLGGNAYFLSDYVGVYRIHSRSLTTKRSSSKWINNVLRQKESILKMVKGKIKHPDIWWKRHFITSYRFYANTSKNRKEKLKLLLWGLIHSHGYVVLYKCIAKELFKTIVHNR